MTTHGSEQKEDRDPEGVKQTPSSLVVRPVRGRYRFRPLPRGLHYGYSHSGAFGPGPLKPYLNQWRKAGASDGQRIVTGSYDHTFSVWDAATTRAERLQKLFEGIRSRNSHE